MPGRPVVPPAATVVGPYSPGVQGGPFLFISGQLPLLPTGELAAGPIGDQTKVCLRNIAQVVQAAGGSLRDLVKVTIYLANMDDFPAVNEAYAAFFDRDPPARVCVGVSRLPKGSRIEIEAIAYLGPSL